VTTTIVSASTATAAVTTAPPIPPLPLGPLPRPPSVPPTFPPTTTKTPAPQGEPTTTTSLVCRNSLNSACGPFYWDPPPEPNRHPLTATLTFAPAAPKVGEIVTFRLVADDPDGPTIDEISSDGVDYGDGTPYRIGVVLVECLGWGPWTPPPQQPFHFEASYEHVYGAAGTYTVTITVREISDCARTPEEITATATVTVGPWSRR
jgi:hypothetical protein